MNAIIGGDEWIGCDIYVCVPCETPPWGAERGAQERNTEQQNVRVFVRGAGFSILLPTPENTPSPQQGGDVLRSTTALAATDCVHILVANHLP